MIGTFFTRYTINILTIVILVASYSEHEIGNAYINILYYIRIYPLVVKPHRESTRVGREE